MSYGNRNDITVAICANGTMLVAQGSGQNRISSEAESMHTTIQDYETHLWFSQLKHRTAVKTKNGYRIVKPSEIYERGSIGYPTFYTKALRGGAVCFVDKV